MSPVKIKRIGKIKGMTRDKVFVTQGSCNNKPHYSRSGTKQDIWVSSGLAHEFQYTFTECKWYWKEARDRTKINKVAVWAVANMSSYNVSRKNARTSQDTVQTARNFTKISIIIQSN
jgi:hypothetical protein